MCFVTKAMPIGYIDSKCHISKVKGSRTCLIDYSDFISREVFHSLGGGHTHTSTHTDFPDKSNFKKPGACGRCTPGLKIKYLIYTNTMSRLKIRCLITVLNVFNKPLIIPAYIHLLSQCYIMHNK